MEKTAKGRRDESAEYAGDVSLFFIHPYMIAWFQVVVCVSLSLFSFFLHTPQQSVVGGEAEACCWFLSLIERHFLSLIETLTHERLPLFPLHVPICSLPKRPVWEVINCPPPLPPMSPVGSIFCVSRNVNRLGSRALCLILVTHRGVSLLLLSCLIYR